MARTSLQDVASLPDPLQIHNWDIIIPNMPGRADSRSFTYKAQSTSMPGAGLESVPVQLHGIELRRAGRATYTHNLEVNLIETRDVGTRADLLRWRSIARDIVDNTGSYSSVYATTVQLLLYDDIPQVVRTINLFNCWPEQIGDTQLDGTQSGIVTTSLTLSYDYFVDV